MDREAGFTIIELIVVMIVIGIISTIAIAIPTNLLPISRDSERADDVTAIARRLEQDFREQATGAPEYPYADKFRSDSQNQTGTASGLDKAVYTAPGESSSSLLAATNNTSSPRGGGTPLLNDYVYQPLAADGSLCTSLSQLCVSFKLYYRREVNNSIVVLRSMHQQ